MQRLNLTGNKYGNWTVISPGKRNDKTEGYDRWVCRCVCGTVKEVLVLTLKNGRSTSCGCLKGKKIADSNRLTTKFVIEKIREFGAEIITPNFEHKHNEDRIDVKWMACGHITNTAYTNIQRKIGCWKCSGHGPSRICIDLLFEVCRSIDQNSVLELPLPGRMYLDIFFPEFLLGVEVQGPRHTAGHRLYNRGQKPRDKRKAKLCKKLGIRLIYCDALNKESSIDVIRNSAVKNKTIKINKHLQILMDKLPLLRSEQNTREDLSFLGKWSDLDLIEDAKKFATRTAWQLGSPGYGCARYRGKNFFEKCCQHMPPGSHQKYTNEELLNIAKKYKVKSEWKNNDNSTYIIAHNRGKEFYKKCTAHMPKRKKRGYIIMASPNTEANHAPKSSEAKRAKKGLPPLKSSLVKAQKKGTNANAGTSTTETK